MTYLHTQRPTKQAQEGNSLLYSLGWELLSTQHRQVYIVVIATTAVNSVLLHDVKKITACNRREIS